MVMEAAAISEKMESQSRSMMCLLSKIERFEKKVSKELRRRLGPGIRQLLKGRAALKKHGWHDGSFGHVAE